MLTQPCVGGGFELNMLRTDLILQFIENIFISSHFGMSDSQQPVNRSGCIGRKLVEWNKCSGSVQAVL